MSLRYQIKFCGLYKFDRFMASKGFLNIQTSGSIEVRRYECSKPKRSVFLAQRAGDQNLTLPQNNGDLYRGFLEWKFSRSQ